VFAFDPNFNEGVVGLAAARLAEAYYRPAVVGHLGPELTRASCRSIPEFHITHALDECRDLLVRHGGHAVAAGFTIRTENLPELKKRLAAIARTELNGRDLCPVLWADQEIPLERLRPEHVTSLFKRLEQLQPTGQGNPEAVFISRNLRVLNSRLVGGEGQHLKLRLITDGNTTYDAIAFRQGHLRQSLANAERVDVMYVFERNEYNGQVSLQLNVRDLKPSGQPD
jgi:single-stranded-DNA-specific exonuclease